MNFKQKLLISIVFFLFVQTNSVICDSIPKLNTIYNIGQRGHKVWILNLFAKSYQDTNIDSSIYYSEQALSYARLSNDTIGLAEALYNIGYIQLIKGENTEAYKNMTQAYNYFSLKNNQYGIACSMDVLGALFRMDGSYEKSFEYHINSLMIFTELKDTAGLISATNNLGIVSRNIGNEDKALTFYREALKLAIKTNSKLLSTVLNSLGSFYWHRQLYDSSLVYYQKALSIEPVTFLLRERHCAVLNNIGNVYRSRGIADSAFCYYKMALQESCDYELNNLSSITLKNYGILYYQTGRTSEAIKSLNQSIDLATKTNFKRIVKEDYQLLSEIYSNSGNYKKALEYQKKYSSLQDLISNEDLINKIAQLNVDFFIQQKEKNEAILLKNFAEQKLEIQKNKNLIITLTFIISLLILIFLLVYRQFVMNKKSANILKEINEELEIRVENRTQKLQQEVKKHELTARELINAKEKAEESDRLKSLFLANLSHEIRTPMNAIMGFADLLGYPDISPAERNNFISIIQNSGNRLLNIIDAIIEISKIEAGQVTPKLRTINLDLFIDNLFNSLVYKISKDKLIELKKIRPDSLTGLNITTDEVKLKQIFTNLINNSIKFTEKGFIAFGYELKSENEIAFIVRDSGVGIDKSDLEFIFERFRRVEGNQAIIKGGPGLGLSISKAYVEMLGGNIFVDSEIGKGAAFTFVLPLERPSLQ